MTPPQMSGPAPAGVLGRAHANVSCQELRPTHTLGQQATLVPDPENCRSIRSHRAEGGRQGLPVASASIAS